MLTTLKSAWAKCGRTLIAVGAAGALLLGGTTAPAFASSAMTKAAADCWTSKFTGYYFPNPVSRSSHGYLKSRVNLLFLDSDFNMHAATVSTQIFALNGGLVYTTSGTYNSAPSQDIVVADVRGLASAGYIVRLTATSDVCSPLSFDARVIVA